MNKFNCNVGLHSLTICSAPMKILYTAAYDNEGKYWRYRCASHSNVVLEGNSSHWKVIIVG